MPSGDGLASTISLFSWACPEPLLMLLAQCWAKAPAALLEAENEWGRLIIPLDKYAGKLAHLLLWHGMLSFHLAKAKIVRALAHLLSLLCGFQKSILKAFKLKDFIQFTFFDRIEYFHNIFQKDRNCFFKDSKVEITADIICIYSKLSCSSENPWLPVGF